MKGRRRIKGEWWRERNERRRWREGGGHANDPLKVFIFILLEGSIHAMLNWMWHISCLSIFSFRLTTKCVPTIPNQLSLPLSSNPFSSIISLLLCISFSFSPSFLFLPLFHHLLVCSFSDEVRSMQYEVCNRGCCTQNVRRVDWVHGVSFLRLSSSFFSVPFPSLSSVYYCGPEEVFFFSEYSNCSQKSGKDIISFFSHSFFCRFSPLFFSPLSSFS